MATFALPCASVTAMARPMPRDPPVTSAAFPLKSNMSVPFPLALGLQRRERLLERRGVLDVHRLDALVDALHEPGEHLARADLHEARHAEPHHLLDALDPAYRGRHLVEEDRHDAPHLAVPLRLDVRHHRDARLLP